MRVTILLVAAALLLSPAAMGAFSTRGVHDDVWNTFTPAPADKEAEQRLVDINCGDGASTARMGDSRPDFDPTDPLVQNHLPCWPDSTGNHIHPADGEETSGNDLWTTSDGQIVGASPPFYQCKATELTDEDGDGTPEPNPVDLEVSFQNPFPIQKTGANAGESSTEGPASQGVLVSSGSFYAIPELSGSDADQVEAIWFGFLETTPTAPGTNVGGGSDELCTELLREGQAASGAYYEYYRGDIDKSDGWTIPVNTLLVPDNTYGAYLKFYGDLDEADEALGDEDNSDGIGLDEQGQPSPGGLELLGMGFVYATTDNFHNDAGFTDDRGLGCTPQRLPCTYQDTTPPWPQITPGDTDFPAAWEGGKASDEELHVIFGEHVQFPNPATSFSLNGEPIEPVSSDPDISDVDSVPLFTVPETGTDAWGQNFVFDVDIEPCDDLTVDAIDTHGNKARKTVEFEDPSGAPCP